MMISDDDYLDLLQNHVSGLLAPGGMNGTNYHRLIKKAYDWTIEGQIDIPIWGTCRGMEYLANATG